MELYYACVLVLFFAFMASLISVKKMFEKKIEIVCKNMAIISLSKAKEDEKIDELFRRVRSLTTDVDGNVELVNKLVLDLEKLEEYMEDRKALDQREERMLSGINNIMAYDMGVAREAVKNLEESED